MKKSADAMWKQAMEGATPAKRMEAIADLLHSGYAAVTSWESDYPADSCVQTELVSVVLAQPGEGEQCAETAAETVEKPFVPHPTQGAPRPGVFLDAFIPRATAQEDTK